MGGRVTQQVLKAAIGRWLPVVGALALGAWSYYTTQKIGKYAVSIFEKEFVDDPEG